MGVKIQRVLNEKKGTAVITAVASGAVTFPPTGSIAIVSVLEGDDVNRFADIERAIQDCYRYIRENNRYGTNGAIAFVRNLNDAKRDVVERSIATDVVTGDVGVMLTGSIRGVGKTLIVEAGFKQLTDYAREQGRLGE